MLAMTLILLTRAISSVLKLNDAENGDDLNYLKVIRISHDVSTYLFGIVIVMLFFQWSQTYRLLSNPQEAVLILTSNRDLFGQISYIMISTVITGVKIYYTDKDIENGG